jgi:hypothetical protein
MVTFVAIYFGLKIINLKEIKKGSESAEPVKN